MRPKILKLYGIIGVLTAIAIFIGCGGGNDLLDEESTRYNAYAIPQDGDEDREEIDVVFRDCDDNATTGDDTEPNYPFDVKVVIESDEDAAEFRVESYTVRFRRNHGSYHEASLAAAEDLDADEMPDLTGTVLNPVNYETSSPVVGPGDTLTIEGLTVWTYWDKIFYKDTVLNGFNPPLGELVFISAGGFSYYEEDLASMAYDMQVTLHCRTLEDYEFDIKTPWTPVVFADVNACS
jgi:hypothetical protein